MEWLGEYVESLSPPLLASCLAIVLGTALLLRLLGRPQSLSRAATSGSCPLGFGGKEGSKVEEEKVVAHRPAQRGEMTLKELSVFKGEEGGTILISLKGLVYDVTRRSDMYGPDAGYHFIAGTDASRALAEMSIDHDLVNRPLENLSLQQRDTLNGWIEFFGNRYEKVGTLIDSPAV